MSSNNIMSVGSNTNQEEVIVDESEISSLTSGQNVALNLVMYSSSVISLVSSGILVYLLSSQLARTKGGIVSRSFHRRSVRRSGTVTQPLQPSGYRRLLFAMSLADIFYTIQVCLQTFLVPADSSYHSNPFAIGNDKSCTALGFLYQAGFSNVFFSGALSTYYFCTIRCNQTEERFAKRVEPWLYALCVGYPLLTASVGAAFGFYRENELGQGCWVNNYPENCGSGPGDSGESCLSEGIAWIFAGIPIVLILLWLAVSNGMIYRHVQQTIRRNTRYAFGNSNHSTSHNNGGDNDNSTSRESKRFSLFPSRNSNRASGSSNIGSGRFSFFHRSSRNTMSNRAGATSAQQERRVRAVATQAFLYVGAFLLTQIWAILIRILEGASMAKAEDEDSLFWPLFIPNSLFVPLQGLFNLLIYVRPRYLKVRREFGPGGTSMNSRKSPVPPQTRWWAFRRALWGDHIEPVIKTKQNLPNDNGESAPTAGTRSSIQMESQAGNNNDGPLAQEEDPSSSSVVRIHVNIDDDDEDDEVMETMEHFEEDEDGDEKKGEDPPTAIENDDKQEEKQQPPPSPATRSQNAMEAVNQDVADQFNQDQSESTTTISIGETKLPNRAKKVNFDAV